MSKLLLPFLLFSVVVLGASKPKPSGPLKAFKGPEGELIVMVEANESKEMLVHFKNVGGALEGKTKLYPFSAKGNSKEVFFGNPGKKDKERSWVIFGWENNGWVFANPTKPSQSFRLTFSQADTDKLKLEDVLKSYQP